MVPSPDILEELLVRASDMAVASQHVVQTLALHDQALEAASDGIAILTVGPDGPVVSYANRAMQALTGYPGRAMIGRPASAIVDADNDPLARQTARDAVAAGREVRDLRLRFRRADGGSFWGQLSLSPIRNETGGVEHFVAAIVDITDRLRAQEALAENERVFRTVLEATSHAVIAVDADGVITYANPRTADTFGYEPGELIGQTIERLIPQRFIALHHGHVRSFFAAPQGRTMGAGLALVALHRDGHEFPMQVGLSPVETSGGPRVFAMCADLTDRYQAEAAVREAEQRARLLMQEAADPLLVLDAAGRIQDVNDQACAALRYERDDLIGRTIGEIHLDIGAFHTGLPLDVLAAGQSVTIEGTYRRRDGSRFPVEVRLGAIATVEGVQILASARDVTERRRARRRLEHLAHYDQLSRLPNRTLFAARLEAALAAARGGGAGAVLLLDLDLFKEVNDTLGHHAGDELLAQVAQRLRRSIRSGDTVARLGGDEFALILAAAREADDVSATAERILATIRAPFTVGGESVVISGSIGITFLRPTSSSDEVMRAVDSTMYRAKRGSLGYAFFDPAIDARAGGTAIRPLGARSAAGEAGLVAS